MSWASQLWDRLENFEGKHEIEWGIKQKLGDYRDDHDQQQADLIWLGIPCRIDRIESVR